MDKKAEHASMMSGYPLARKVHAEFEQAVQLDPRNAAALADLGEFNVMAPAMLGGGIGRAPAIAQQLGERQSCRSAHTAGAHRRIEKGLRLRRDPN